MSDDTLLLTLQHGDSFFPTGSIAFSWGLEGLHRDGLVRNAEELLGFIEGQLLGRWGTCDLPAILLAYRSRGALDEVAAVDAALETLTLPQQLREGSRKSGAALLGVHEKLGTSGAAPYRAMVRSVTVAGHLPAVQGLLWFHIGASEASACAMSAHAATVGLLGAAVRLAIVGHLDAQRILTKTHAVIKDIIAGRPASDLDQLSSYAPAAEIAAMRHETRDARLFFN